MSHVQAPSSVSLWTAFRGLETGVDGHDLGPYGLVIETINM